MKKRILMVFGTRPEAIKMAPLVLALKALPELFETAVCVTGQHREMLDQVLKVFDIVPDFDLNIMRRGQDLYDVTERVLSGMRPLLQQWQPDLVLVHGDTTTSMAAALAAFYHPVTVGHVEAGMRTHNIYNPWPEEMNRQLTCRMATYHFAPTAGNRRNLLDEGIDDSRIVVTGNTVIDALDLAVDRLNNNRELAEEVQANLLQAGYDVRRLADGRPMVLVTGHRRENFGQGMLNICKAIRQLAIEHPDTDFIYPMHLNPHVRSAISEIFGEGDESLPNAWFIEPLDYMSFVYLMSQSRIVLTDSGGIQEEAPGLHKPVLVMRSTTERPEAVDGGTVRLVGTDTQRIVDEVNRLLTDDNAYFNMIDSINPYGDGHACERIVNFLKHNL